MSLADEFGQAAGVGPAAAASKPMARGGTSPAASAFNTLHPRVSKGRSGGGRFAKKGEKPAGAERAAKTLERNLAALGFSADAKGLADFQKSRGLKATGRFDPETERAFRNAVYAAASSAGEKRSPVAPVEKDIAERTKGIQARLDAAGFIVSQSGTWTAKDDQALKAFQQRNGIKASPARVFEDGSVRLDPETEAALARVEVAAGDAGGESASRSGGTEGRSVPGGGDARASAEPVYAASGDGMGRDAQPDSRVFNVQERLDGLGYELGDAGVDGRFGSATEGAVKRFQRDNGLAPTGKVDADTWYVLTKLSAERESRRERDGVALSADEPAGNYSRGSKQADRQRRDSVKAAVAARRRAAARGGSEGSMGGQTVREALDAARGECVAFQRRAAALTREERAAWREADRERRLLEAALLVEGAGAMASQFVLRDRNGRWAGSRKRGGKMESIAAGLGGDLKYEEGAGKTPGPTVKPRPRAEASSPERDAMVEEFKSLIDNSIDSDPKRLARAVELADAIGVKDWPKPTEGTVKMLAGESDTQSLHSEMRGGKRVYSAARKAMHDQIIDYFLRGESEDGDYLPRGDDPPRAFWFMGGPASGKSSAAKHSKDLMPRDAVVINPDEIKSLMPEYQAAVNAGDAAAAFIVHEESSDISKRLMAEAISRNLNIVIDGTGNGKRGKFVSKVQEMKAAGYSNVGFMVSKPTDAAYVWATKRALSAHRWVPGEEIKHQHRSISANFDTVQQALEDGIFEELRGVDTTNWEPRLMFHSQDGHFIVDDEERYSAFRGKGRA